MGNRDTMNKGENFLVHGQILNNHEPINPRNKTYEFISLSKI